MKAEGLGGADVYNMAGVSYFRKKDAALLAEAIREAYRKPGQEQFFWDEVVNQKLDILDLGVHAVKAEQIVEMDTAAELAQVDPQYRNLEQGR